MIVDSFSLSISRSIKYLEGSNLYIITATASVVANDAPESVRLDQNVFVKSTSDGSFQRVASASDLGLLKSSAPTAKAVNHTEYRDSVLELEFTDIDTALSAIPVVRDRVNTSVANYIQYVTEFNQINSSVPVEYSLPLPASSSKEEELTAAYSGAKAARQAAEGATATAQAQLDSVGYKAEVLTEISASISSAVDSLQSNSEAQTAAHSSLISGSTGLNAAYQALVSGAVPVEADNQPTVYTISEALFSQLKNALNLAQDSVVPQSQSSRDAIVAASGALAVANSYVTTEKSNADIATASATAALKSSAEEAVNLAAIESSALASLLEFCPTVDPNLV